MANEANAPADAQSPAELRDEDYRSFCAALESSARGRDFLAEYARRNRHADTQMLLGALDRLEAQMRADGSALERLRDELRMLLIAIRLSRPGIAAAGPQAKTAKLADLLDMMERRIDAIAEGKSADGKVADVAPPAELPAASSLAIVPPLDEPELPIPSPAGAQPPAIALVQAPEKWLPDFSDDPAQIIHSKPASSAAFMPEITFGDAPPPVLGPSAAAPMPPVAATPTIEEPPQPAAPPRSDAIAAIMALSEAERIALFT
jgi:hypothetical protein